MLFRGRSRSLSQRQSSASAPPPNWLFLFTLSYPPGYSYSFQVLELKTRRPHSSLLLYPVVISSFRSYNSCQVCPHLPVPTAFIRNVSSLACPGLSQCLSSGCCNKKPYLGLTERTLLLVLEAQVQGQDASMVKFWQRPSSWLIDSCFFAVSSHDRKQ